MARARNSDLLTSLFADLKRTATARKKGDKWADKAGTLRGMLMPKQALAEQDRGLRVAIRSARQTGKSTGALLLALIRCLERSQSEWVVAGLTRPSVKRIYWLPLQRLNESLELGIKFQFQEMIATLPNGSRITFLGVENRTEIEKLRGGRFHGVIIDECKSFGISVFKELIEDVLEPALLGQGGQLILIGTPGELMRGEFYLATCEPAFELQTGHGPRSSNCRYLSKSVHPAIWSLHVWTLEDNVTVFRDSTGTPFTLWEKALETKVRHGWSDDHPTWRREYLGHWVAIEGKMVYRYHPHIHDYMPCADTRWGMPGDKGSQWRTVIGFDFGTRDGTAIVVWAYSPTEPGLWELYSEKRSAQPGQKMPVSEIAEWYHEVEAAYGPFDAWPADMAGLATMVMDTLAVDHGVYLEPAEKKQKLDYIQLFNNDLDAGFIHLKVGSELGDEMAENRWLEKTLKLDKRKEDPSTPNDLCDAALYAFRWCQHRKATARIPTIQMFTPAWYAEMATRDLKAAEARARNAHSDAAVLDREWWNDDTRSSN